MNSVVLSSPFFIRDDDELAVKLKAALEVDEGDAFDFVQRIRGESKSMLSQETLTAIHFLARHTGHAIMEIGAYIGGATLTVLHATQARRNPFVTLEEPVVSNHPQLPTKDSVRDLIANLKTFGLVRPEHSVIPGASFEAWVVGNVYLDLMGKKIGLMIWDADACFDRDYFLFGSLFADDCIIMIDDYMVTQEHKAGRITTVVDEMVQRGILEPLALLPWATWFGRVLRRSTQEDLTHFRRQWEALSAEGDVYYRRWLGHIERQQREKYTPPITKDDRIAFWRLAAAQRKQRG